MIARRFVNKGAVHRQRCLKIFYTNPPITLPLFITFKPRLFDFLAASNHTTVHRKDDLFLSHLPTYFNLLTKKNQSPYLVLLLRFNLSLDPFRQRCLWTGPLKLIPDLYCISIFVIMVQLFIHKLFLED